MSSYPKLPPRLERIFPDIPVFFVTFCTHQRKNLLATDSIHAAFREFAIRAHVEHNVAVGRYVIMPDHIHLFVCGPHEFDLGRWVGTLKQHLAKRGNLDNANPVWQRGFFDQFCVVTRAMNRNGITFAKIPFAPT